MDQDIIGAPVPWRELAARALAGPHANVAQLAIRQGLVVACFQAHEMSASVSDLRRMVRQGRWSRPRYGMVAVVPMDAAARPVLEATAAARAWRNSVVSGVSALAVHGLPLIAPAYRPELTGPWGVDRRDVAIFTGSVCDPDVTGWFGARVTTVARTLVDLARSDRRQALVGADAALRQGLVTRAELTSCLDRCARWPGVDRARWILAMACPLAESALESLTRLCLSEAGLPLPELQVVIRDVDGWFCRVDFLWPSRGVVLEADGRLKYSNDALWEEKKRQERIERLGFRVVRVTWSDVVDRPQATVDRVRAALALGAPAAATYRPS